MVKVLEQLEELHTIEQVQPSLRVNMQMLYP